MLISHNWLKGYYTNPEKIPAPEKVAELFTMHAFEVESVEEKGDDTIYDIKLTADRAPYAYALRYVALELSLLVPGLQLSPEIYNFYTTNFTLDEVLSVVNGRLVDADVREDCQMYSLTKIENVNNGASPDWLKNALESIGQQTRGLLVDLTNYVMFDCGQPLHVFDADKIEGQIHVGRSLEGEKITILGGKEIALPTGTPVIRDDADILAIAGVKGGVKAEVHENTKNVYLESAHFSAVKVRRTARGLNLLNDSSKRFEQNLTSERFLAAQQTYIHLITYVCPDAKVGELQTSVDAYQLLDTNKLRKITVDIPSASIAINKEDGKVPQLLREFLENILLKTGAKVEKKDENTYIVTQPHYRSDLISQADVVDEFLRNKGYDFLKYTEPAKNKVEALKDPMDKLCAMLRNYFISIGFDQVSLHTLVDKKEQTDAVLLENALTFERNSLRGNLSTNLSLALEQNLKHLDMVGASEVKLFEIGRVFSDQGNDVGESIHLAYGVAAIKKFKNSDFIDKEMQEFIEDIKVTMMDKGNIQVFEINLDDIVDQYDSEKIDQILRVAPPYIPPQIGTYKKASIYPAMSRDIAFFGSQDQVEVAEFIKNQVAKYPLIENYLCFDIFLKEDKSSYAYRFVFQSYEKTLTEEEVSVFMNEIAEAVKGQGWEVR